MGWEDTTSRPSWLRNDRAVRAASVLAHDCHQMQRAIQADAEAAASVVHLPAQDGTAVVLPFFVPYSVLTWSCSGAQEQTDVQTARYHTGGETVALLAADAVFASSVGGARDLAVAGGLAATGQATVAFAAPLAAVEL